MRAAFFSAFSAAFASFAAARFALTSIRMFLRIAISSLSSAFTLANSSRLEAMARAEREVGLDISFPFVLSVFQSMDGV